MRLILHADDFGASQDIYTATVDCFDKGVLTSASLMPLMPYSHEAIGYAKSHPEFSFGAHLTFARVTVERPVSDPGMIPHLVNEDGEFMNSDQIRTKAFLHKIPIGEIEREIEAQLGYFRDHGLNLSHIDSHCHIHKLGHFPEALARVLPRFSINRVRTVQNIYVRKPLRSPTYWLGDYWAWRIRKKFITTDNFFMPRETEGYEWARDYSWLNKVIAGCHGKTIEMGFHPGFLGWNDQERRALLCLADFAREKAMALTNWQEIAP